jgi:hypothetical protein
MEQSREIELIVKMKKAMKHYEMWKGVWLQEITLKANDCQGVQVIKNP